MPTSGVPSEGLTTGQVFAGYTIIRHLGAGGMGQVYLAQHPRLPRRDALKVLSGDMAGDDEFRQRFNREADLAASLYHEHIVGIHDRGEYDGRLWLSMDYVEGIDASALLRTRYPSGMPKADVAEIISAVADALDYAHARGLLHRDVKPANILLGDGTPRRRILLADFGIARELGEISGLTATNMLVGTTAYCSPEQLRGADLDARTDQYALGCTAYELLVGAAPFHHSNPAVVIGQHLSAPPPLLSERRPDLADCDPAISRALAKNPQERYASCADFAAALTSRPEPGYAAPTNVIATPTEVIARAQDPTPRAAVPAAPEAPRRRVGVVTVLGALVAVALLGLGAVVGVRLLAHHANPTASGDASQSPTPGGATPKPGTPGAGEKLTGQLTDHAGALGPAERNAVDRALRELHDARGIKLWVVYVKNFGGLKPFRWAEETVRANGFNDADAILAVATEDRAFAFRVPGAAVNGTGIDVAAIRRDRIEPAVARREWPRAAIAAARGLNTTPG